MSCPICAAPTVTRFRDTPYLVCPICDAWFQDPLPEKTYEAAHEKTQQGGSSGHLMSEHDREVNRSLARTLFGGLLKGRPGRTLDVGSKYPFLARCLKDQGCASLALDAIDETSSYADELDVPTIPGDLEIMSRDDLLHGGEPYQLVTLIHVFEHLYDPISALRKLRSIVADDGRVFLRLPDHNVSGFERDLTPGHFSIHPFFHTLSSILEILAQTKDLFAVESTYPMDGAGQRDITLRPILRKPTIVAGLIVKNEERDLPRALRSLRGVVDEVVIVDTGSTDRTIEVAEEVGKEFDLPIHTQTYLGASKRNPKTGDHELWDFGKARNVFVREIERRSPDWLLWFDADDELTTPNALRRATYLDQYAVIGVSIHNGRDSFIHHRLWRPNPAIRFHGRCHEYPSYGGFPTTNLHDVVIQHDTTPGAGENANARNLRILSEEAVDAPSPRVFFYLAQTHKDGGRFAEAVPWYDRRIHAGEGYRDEWLMAWLNKARCQRAAGEARAAERTLLQAVGEERTWAELWMELAYLAYDDKRFTHAMGYALQAHDAPIPPTGLWRERNKYTDQPARMISWCLEHVGDREGALLWARKAKERIGSTDRGWNDRIARLEGRESTKTAPRRIIRSGKPRTTESAIALLRPGAIGDVLMTLNLVPALRAANPNCAIHYFCDEGIGLGLSSVMLAAGVDEIHDHRNLRAEDHERVVNLIGYPIHEGYPEVPMRRHLLRYFAAEMGLPDNGDLPCLALPRPMRPAETLPARYATLQIRTGWSAYKNWPYERWAEVVSALPDVRFVQIGTADEPRVPGADHAFMGTPIRAAIALVANASLHVGLDSFANHLTHYRWRGEDGLERRVPGVVVWGSTQPSASGYATNTNIHLGLPCQPCFREDPAISRMPRGPCIEPPGQIYEDPKHACMTGIDIKDVVQAIRLRWNPENRVRLPLLQEEKGTMHP